MKILLDLNILLDVVQKRQPHYQASAAILDFAIRNQCCCICAHQITTLYYLVNKYAGHQQASELIDWLLQNAMIVPEDKETFLRARVLDFKDFEDAVTSAAAQQQQCQFIITRNGKDFKKSPIPALSPLEFLAMQ